MPLQSLRAAFFLCEILKERKKYRDLAQHMIKMIGEVNYYLIIRITCKILYLFFWRHVNTLCKGVFLYSQFIICILLYILVNYQYIIVHVGEPVAECVVFGTSCSVFPKNISSPDGPKVCISFDTSWTPLLKSWTSNLNEVFGCVIYNILSFLLSTRDGML